MGSNHILLCYTKIALEIQLDVNYKIYPLLVHHCDIQPEHKLEHILECYMPGASISTYNAKTRWSLTFLYMVFKSG